MAITAIIDESTGAALKGDVYLDDTLVASDAVTATLSLGAVGAVQRVVRVEAPGYHSWTVGVRRHNASGRPQRISGPVKLTPVQPHSLALPFAQG